MTGTAHGNSGIGEKMVDKIYQAVNQFYEGGGTAAVSTEATPNPAKLLPMKLCR